MGICEKLVAEGGPHQTLKTAVMTIRRWAYLIGILLVCAIAGGAWMIYSRKCHGVDACAAQSAEGHERDVPREPQ
jgi:hypothetical protein